MSRDGIIKLISTISTVDENGESITDDIGVSIISEVERTVFCTVESISQSEFFSAGQQNLKPEYKLTVFMYDYLDEGTLEYNGVKYSIYRTFVAKNEKIELYCTKKVGV